MSAPELNESQRAVANWLNWLFERDSIGHAPSFLTYPHHQIHEGNYFSFGTRIPALNGSVSYLLYNLGTAITTKRAHLEQFLNADGVVRGFLYQDPTVVNPGTLLGDPPIWNHKQGAGTAVALEVYINPNLSDVGTLRISLDIGAAGIGQTSLGGAGGVRDEMILDNDKYWLAVLDTDGAQIVNYAATWYEK